MNSIVGEKKFPSNFLGSLAVSKTQAVEDRLMEKSKHIYLIYVSCDMEVSMRKGRLKGTVRPMYFFDRFDEE